MRWQPVTGTLLIVGCLWGGPVLGCGTSEGNASVAMSFKAMTDLPFTVLETGTYSGLKTERTLVVRDEATWKALYAEHRPDQAPPKVDFAHQMVVVVVLQRNTGGYSVKLDRIQNNPSGLQVDYTESKPSADTITTQALTQPYVFALVERRDGPVSFQRHETTAPTPQ